MKLLSLIILFNIIGFSQDEISQKQIIDKFKINQIYKNVIIEGKIIINKRINDVNKAKIREFKIYNKFFDSGKYDYKNLLLFLSPINLKNTSVLSWYSNIDHDSSKRFIYFPSLKKTQQINFNNKNNFYGFNFFYFEFIRGFRNNLIDKNVDISYKDNYLILKTINLNKTLQNKIFSQSVWIDKESFNIKRIEFFNIKEKLITEISFLKFDNFGTQTFPTEFEIINYDKKNTILFQVTNIEFSTVIEDDIFNENFSFLKN